MKFSEGVISVISVAALTTTIGALDANASTKATTPMLGYRYAKKTANYQDLSTSAYYKDVWNSATGDWRTNGFNWTKKTESKTSVSSYDGGSDLSVAGYNSVSYNKTTGKIISSKVRINRTAFTKYGYSKAQRKYVAEHELGHALGLAHNNAGSISVMNPANRYYNIKGCDVKGMKARYATTTSFDSVSDDASNIVTVTEYLKITPKVSSVKTSYNTKKHAVTIKGRANVSKLALQYKGKKVANVKVKSGKFAVTKAFKGYGNFKLVNGTNTLKTIKSTRYATPAVTLVSAERTAKGMHYRVTGKKGAQLVIARKGKTVKRIKTTGKTTKIYVKNALIKNSSKHLTMTQKAKNLKTSKAIKLPALKVGIKQVTNYNY